jgi:transposase-like protein
VSQTNQTSATFSEEIRKVRSQFRKGSGCFECRACGKKTRENGSSNSQVQLCPKCQAQFERENSESDAS